MEMKWMPIFSAPLDGTSILLNLGHNRIISGKWKSWKGMDDRGTWIDFNGGEISPVVGWMPLPDSSIDLPPQTSDN